MKKKKKIRNQIIKERNRTEKLHNFDTKLNRYFQLQNKLKTRKRGKEQLKFVEKFAFI